MDTKTYEIVIATLAKEIDLKNWQLKQTEEENAFLKEKLQKMERGCEYAKTI